MIPRFAVSAFAFLSLLSLSRADSVAALRARLVALKAPAVLSAEAVFARLPAPNKPLPAGNQPVGVHVHEDLEGLRVSWAQPLLATFADEARREVNDPNPSRVVAQGLDEIHATTVWKYLHAADEIELRLSQSKLTSEETTTYEGQPAKLLVFTVTPVLNDQAKKYVKEISVSLKLWVAPDFTPLAAGSKSHVRGRAFLVIGFESNDSELYRFGNVRDRLVVTRHQKEGTGSGGGENNSYNQETKLTFSET